MGGNQDAEIGKRASHSGIARSGEDVAADVDHFEMVGFVAGAGLGLRPGELFGLRVDRVEFLRRKVRVDTQLVCLRGIGVRPGPLKTAASYRTVPLPDVVAAALASHLDARPPHHELGLVFTNERLAPIQQHPFARVFENARARTDLPAMDHTP